MPALSPTNTVSLTTVSLTAIGEAVTPPLVGANHRGARVAAFEGPISVQPAAPVRAVSCWYIGQSQAVGAPRANCPASTHATDAANTTTTDPRTTHARMPASY